MVIRAYREDDEKKWLACRVLSFLDTSYHDDVMTKRVKYENDAICLVASEDEKIVGLIDVEIFLDHQHAGKIYGVDELVIKTECSRRKELSDYCDRMEEVRLYVLDLD